MLRRIRGLSAFCLALLIGAGALPAQDAPALPDAPSVDVQWQQQLHA